MDIRTVKKLIELVENTGIGEIEIKEGDTSIRVSRYPSGTAHANSAPAITHQHFSAPGSASGETSAPKETPPAEPAGHQVKSPMVGTIYLAPTPGAKPFVQLGQRVEAGHVICLIEAMKMFNQIEADKSGVISARLVENEQPVEYDQPLFIIDEAG